MSSWLLWFIGISHAMTSEATSVSLHWSRPGFLVAGGVMVLPLTWWVYHRQRRNLPHIGRFARSIMTTCRVLLFVLLMLVLAGPYVRIEELRSERPVIAVLHDVSASMDLQAGPFSPDEMKAMADVVFHAAQDENSSLDASKRQQLNDMTRSEVATQILTGPLLSIRNNQLQNYDWRFYEVDRVIRESTMDNKMSSRSETDRHETALGLALERVFADTAGRRLGAVLLFSDGRNTTGSLPLTVLREHLTTADQSAPIIPIRVGSSQPRADVAIVDVLAAGEVTLGDAMTILATIHTSGYEGKQVDVVLRQKDAELDRETITLTGNLKQQVTLTFEPERVGPGLLEVTIDPQPDESLTTNNRRIFPIQVDSDSIRVLYIEGYPRWDFRFLDHELRRDRGLDVTQVMEATLRAADIPEPELPAGGQLPMTQEAFAAYDLVMLGDVSPLMLPPSLVDSLDRAVREDGVGLLVQAGFRHMPHDFIEHRDAGLEALLPVTFEQRSQPVDGGFARGGEQAPAFQPFSMNVTAAGSINPAFHLFTSATRNRELWSQMPVFYWAASTQRPRAGAIELARVVTAEGAFPLIATHFAGRGRVMFIGTDSTYRWRRNIGSALFSRFWGQAIRHVARQPEQSPDRSAITAYPPRVEPGENVHVELYAVDVTGEPLQSESIEVRHMIDGSDEQATTTKPITLRRSGAGGYYRGSFEPQVIGQHTVTYRSSDGLDIAAAVQVESSKRELMFADIDDATLTQIAELTSGQMLLPDDLEKLTTLIQAQPTQSRRVIEEDIWDNWLMLILLVGLYCTDVGTRRILGLT